MPCGHPDNSNLHRGDHPHCGCTERGLDRACDYRFRRNCFSICAERATDAFFESHGRFVVQHSGVFGDLNSGRLQMFAKLEQRGAAWRRDEKLANRRADHTAHRIQGLPHPADPLRNKWSVSDRWGHRERRP